MTAPDARDGWRLHEIGGGYTIEFETGRHAAYQRLDGSGWRDRVYGAETPAAGSFGDARNNAFDAEAAARGVLLVGNAGNDRLTGSRFGDRLSGGDGADVLLAGGGDDLLFLDADDTQVFGGAGRDVG